MTNTNKDAIPDTNADTVSTSTPPADPPATGHKPDNHDTNPDKVSRPTDPPTEEHCTPALCPDCGGAHTVYRQCPSDADESTDPPAEGARRWEPGDGAITIPGNEEVVLLRRESRPDGHANWLCRIAHPGDDPLDDYEFLVADDNLRPVPTPPNGRDTDELPYEATSAGGDALSWKVPLWIAIHAYVGAPNDVCRAAAVVKIESAVEDAMRLALRYARGGK